MSEPKNKKMTRVQTLRAPASQARVKSETGAKELFDKIKAGQRPAEVRARHAAAAAPKPPV